MRRAHGFARGGVAREEAGGECAVERGGGARRGGLGEQFGGRLGGRARVRAALALGVVGVVGVAALQGQSGLEKFGAGGRDVSGGRTGLDIRVGNGVKVEKGIGRREWVGWARNRVAQSGMEVSLRRCRATLAVASRRRDCESSDSGKRRALAYRGKVSGNALV